MVVFPNCKINLGLRITGKRIDGYHDLSTVFYPIPLRDAAEAVVISENPDRGHPGFELITTGAIIPGDITTNLCFKAWKLLSTAFPSMPPVKMFLHKVIPPGAGLGGGSSNGAFTLLLINELLKLNLSKEQLRDFALQLGSDCPFFILNKPSYATGRGEVMQEQLIDLHNYHIILIHPGIHINTGWAFSELSAKDFSQAEPSSVSEIISQPVSEWKGGLRNDFEIPVFRRYPELARAKEALYNAGAEYASMTGTGSTIYGLFNRNKQFHLPQFNPAWKIFHLNAAM